jgi:hypothetical protein
MSPKLAKILPLLLLLTFNFLLFTPITVLAQNKAATVDTATRCSTFLSQFKLSTGSNIVKDSNLPQFCSATEIILFAFNLGMALAGTVTIVFLMVGGFFYVTSAGNEEQAEKGRKILINAVIGLVVIILSTAIVRILANLLNTGK